MQSETGFPSSHQLKFYVASKSRLKLAAHAVLSADADLLVDTGNDIVTDLVNEGHEGNMLQELLPSYVLCGAHSQSFCLVNQ